MGFLCAQQAGRVTGVMSLTILIAAAGSSGSSAHDQLADQVATGALRAAPAAVVLRAVAGDIDARLARADLVITAGVSALTAEVSRRAAELGVAVVALGGTLAAAGRELYPVGIAAFEPDGHPTGIDTDLPPVRLRQAAARVVDMTLACQAA